MSGDTREMVIQLIVGVLCAALVSVALLRLRRPPRRAILIPVAGVVLVALLLLGMVEARVIAAVVAGAAGGIVIAGAVILIRGHRTGPPRILALVGLVLVADLPLVALEAQIGGESMIRMTRVAAETSAGSWVVAWQRSWQLLVEPELAHLRIPIAAVWTALTAVAFALVGIAGSRVLQWRSAAPLSLR